MNKYISFVILLTTLSFISCGTTREQKPPQPDNINLQTYPQGAKVYIDNRLVATNTPTILSIPPKTPLLNRVTNKKMKEAEENNAFTLKIVKEGYKIIEDKIKPKLDVKGWNLKFIWPENLIYELERKNDIYTNDPTIPVGAEQERVTRDTSGKTELERTIIRWYFDSEPQGARIFWRVISSIPEEVKNTNELWLGSTPFEETRSFNIQGLTYENSRNVQIEIKVKRKGYIDQNKRFNVRQAIDQQEISSFFDMVKSE